MSIIPAGSYHPVQMYGVYTHHHRSSTFNNKVLDEVISTAQKLCTLQVIYIEFTMSLFV